MSISKAEQGSKREILLEDVALLDGGSPAPRGTRPIKKRADWEKIRPTLQLSTEESVQGTLYCLADDGQLQTVWQACMIPADWWLIGAAGVALRLCNIQSGKETPVVVKDFCDKPESYRVEVRLLTQEEIVTLQGGGQKFYTIPVKVASKKSALI
jgi:hypothetical protein